jgi:hypothetical protein
MRGAVLNCIVSMLLVCGRWILAIAAAFCASVIAFLFTAVNMMLLDTVILREAHVWLASPWWHYGSRILTCAVSAAAGVTTGTLVLGREHRRVGGVALYVLGLVYYGSIVAQPTVFGHNSWHRESLELVGLAVGGLIPAVWFVLRSPANQSRQPTASPPRLSTP